VKLLVDIGNTRVKWAWLDAGGALRDPGGLAHGGTVPQGWPGVVLGGRRPEAVLAASVAAPALAAALLGPLAPAGVPLEQATVEREAAGVRNGYADPRQLGVDRWLAVLAARARHPTAVCVVDAGTAVTVDAVDAAGQHLGGFIVPGAGLMRRALLERTGGIAAAAGLAGGAGGAGPGAPAATAPGDGPWGRDTDACIDRGARLALACLVRGCMEALAPPGRAPATLVLTGGDAAALRAALDQPAELRPHLVLEGLALRATGRGWTRTPTREDP